MALDWLLLPEIDDHSTECRTRSDSMIVLADLALHTLQNESMSANSTIKVNSLPNSKILDWFKFISLSDDKINVIQNMKLVFEWVENILENGENTGNQHFLLFPKCFQ